MSERADQKIKEYVLNPGVVLDLSGLGLEDLPQSLKDAIDQDPSQFDNLEFLELYNNHFTGPHLDFSILQNLKNLKKISLAVSHLTHVPTGLTEIATLEDLRLGFNNITDIPETIHNLSQLNRFEAHANKIKKIPETLFEIERLEQMSLYGNKISYLPEKVTELTKLDKLHLQNNSFTEYPQIWEQLEFTDKKITISNIWGLFNIFSRDNKLDSTTFYAHIIRLIKYSLYILLFYIAALTVDQHIINIDTVLYGLGLTFSIFMALWAFRSAVVKNRYSKNIHKFLWILFIGGLFITSVISFPVAVLVIVYFLLFLLIFSSSQYTGEPLDYIKILALGVIVCIGYNAITYFNAHLNLIQTLSTQAILVSSQCSSEDLKFGLTNIFNAFYFSSVTFTTLGYGDFRPCNEVTRFFVMLQVLFGFIIMGLFVSVVAASFSGHNREKSS